MYVPRPFAIQDLEVTHLGHTYKFIRIDRIPEALKPADLAQLSTFAFNSIRNLIRDEEVRRALLKTETKKEN